MKNAMIFILLLLAGVCAADSLHVSLVGRYDTGDWAYGVYVSGSYAYVADEDDGLRIIDVSDPSSPSEVGFYDTGGSALGVYVSGSYAYVADEGGGLYILDVSYVTGIEEGNIPMPNRLSLSVYPNPFNSAVSISAPGNAIVEIFNINGRCIAEFDGGDQVWKPEASVGSGIYLVRARFDKLTDRGEEEVTKRVVYLK